MSGRRMHVASTAAGNRICTPRKTGSSSRSAGGRFLESKSFPEDADFLLDTMSREKLQSLARDDAGQGSVAEDDWFRSEASKLHEVSTLLNMGMAVEEEDMPKKEQLYRELFMILFPRVREKLMACIGELHTLADKVDKVHRDCTISNVAASSTSAVSGILTIVGLCLAPMTSGASLALLATGMGLGAAAIVTSASASIVDRSHSSMAKAKAYRLLSTDINKEKVTAKALLRNASEIVPLASKWIGSSVGIMKSTKAIKMATKDPQSLSKATETMLVKTSNQEQKALRGTVQAVSKNAQIIGVTMSVFGLLIDVISLVDQSHYLHKGTKAATAEELRNQAQALEEKLALLTRTYEQLQRT
ncbi:apolipoprotein L3 isoform X7 [Rousettus aegyptiacus]|uniref:apolipoprotein L3 isoform X7 n=1 Tax=Rousettus aegyptiacus TaxID=9407 RepID=UPI00168D616A|nr:apolipoprotein L3 isoform X7 [Rousettus aegyptiacus]XP_016017181.2 apolipoprotein L3 isoform X7 [Rousettus aegyptiacus]XP_036093333.1 apolipoprotein L3 isoform X7 [Rousettus aegyptiacus]